MRQRVDGTGPWRQVTYAEMVSVTRRVGQWLINTGHRPGDAIAILSGPSIEHVIMMLSAQRAGIAAASISTNYSLLDQPSEKLRRCVAAIGARIAFVADVESYAPAMRWLGEHGVSFVVHGAPLPDVECASFESICQTVPDAAVDCALAAVSTQTVARIMFTSGSTGTPKATRITNGSLMASIAQREALGFLPQLPGEVPQVLESMPFSHIFAGTAGLNNALYTGATVHLDAGRPTPELFHQTMTNLVEVSPTWFGTAPLGYSMLVDAMQRGSELRKSFFKKLRYMLVSGATLPQAVRERINAFALEETGRIIPMTSAYGSTETAATIFAHWDNHDTSIIGLPAPGVEVKLAPHQGRYELRVRGPNVMQRDGYIDHVGGAEQAFDDEGFFRTGDAAKLVDADSPAAGLRFDGRFGEQFKLTSATYVTAGSLRLDVLGALHGLLGEICICGENRDFLAALAWVNPAEARRRFPELADASVAEIVAAPAVREAVTVRLRGFNRDNPTSSRRIRRLLPQHEPLSFDAGEITEKGNTSMRAIWSRRAQDVERLYADTPDWDVIIG
jgi:feruloyl-CoA synthase